MTNMVGNRGDIVSRHKRNQKIFDEKVQYIPGHIGIEWLESLIQLMMEINWIILDGTQWEIKR